MDDPGFTGPGCLDRRVVLQAPTHARMSDGSYTQAWVTQSTVWAQVLQLSGNEERHADGYASVVDYRIRVWRDTSIRPTWRVVLDDGTIVQLRYVEHDRNVTMMIGSAVS